MTRTPDPTGRYKDAAGRTRKSRVGVTKDPIAAPGQHVHRCDCGWYRVHPTLRTANDRINHPVWGEITTWQAATFDVDAHRCDLYRTALKELQKGLASLD